MTDLPFNDAVARFIPNESRVNDWVNGDASTDMITSGGTHIPSVAKFMAVNDIAALNAAIAAVASRATTLENDAKPEMLWTAGLPGYYDHTGITGAAARTLYLPLNLQVKHGTDTLVNATLTPASSRLNTHFEFVIASATIAYLVYLDRADSTIKAVASTALANIKGVISPICVIANGKVHQAGFEIINLLNDIPLSSLGWAVQERDDSTGRNDKLVVALMRGYIGSVSNLVSPNAGMFFQEFTGFGATQEEVIYFDYARHRAGTNPLVRFTCASTTIEQPNNRLMIELFRGHPAGPFADRTISSRLGLRVLGDGSGGVVRNQVMTGRLPPDVSTLPSWLTVPASEAPTYVDIDDTWDPGSVARTLGFTKGWVTPSGTSNQLLVGSVVRNAHPGTYIAFRYWALSPIDNVYDISGVIGQAMSDSSSIGVTVAIEKVWGVRLFTVTGYKYILNTEDVNYMRAGWNTASHKFMIIGFQACAGHNSPGWMMWNDFPLRPDQGLFIPRKWNWFSDVKMPFNHHQARHVRTRFNEYPLAAMEYKHVDKLDAGVVDLSPYGNIIDTSVVNGDCIIIQDRINDSPGNIDYYEFELEVVPTSACAGDTYHYLSFGDSTAESTGKAAFVKQTALRFGATACNTYGGMTQGGYDNLSAPATLSEGRIGKKLADYAGYEFGSLILCATDADWVAYLAGDETYRHARNPFLRLWVGGDPVGRKRHNSIDGLDYIVDFGRYMTKMGYAAVPMDLFDCTMVFNDLGSTAFPDGQNNMLAAMEDFRISVNEWKLSVGRTQTSHLQFTLHQMAWGDVVTTNQFKYNGRHAPAYQLMLDWFNLNSASVAIHTGGNSGNGYVKYLKVRYDSVVGLYKVTMTSATAFTVKYPDGSTVGMGTATVPNSVAEGTTFIGGGIEFVIGIGSVAFVSGDEFWLTCDKTLHLNPGLLTSSVMGGWAWSIDPASGKRKLSASGQIHTRDGNTRPMAMESLAIMARYH